MNLTRIVVNRNEHRRIHSKNCRTGSEMLNNSEKLFYRKERIVLHLNLTSIYEKTTGHPSCGSSFDRDRFISNYEFKNKFIKKNFRFILNFHI